MILKVKSREIKFVATEVMPEIASRRALYVATLLHDIAKGEEVIIQNSELSWLWQFARDWLTSEETETVSWLVL